MNHFLWWRCTITFREAHYGFRLQINNINWKFRNNKRKVPIVCYKTRNCLVSELAVGRSLSTSDAKWFRINTICVFISMQIWRTDTKLATSWIQIVICYCKWNQHVTVTRMRLAACSTVILEKLTVTKLLKYSLPVTEPEISLLQSQQPVTSVHSPFWTTQIQHIPS